MNPKSNLAILAKHVYFQFKFVVKLKQVVRQQNINGDLSQQLFIDLLPRCRDGQSTIADWKHLLTRIPTMNNLKDFEDAIRLFIDKNSVNKYNDEKLI
jgi:hypothetical protein